VIDPKVENPIDRLPLRPDLFTKAAQLGILNTAGSKLGEYLNLLQLYFKFKFDFSARKSPISTAGQKCFPKHLQLGNHRWYDQHTFDQ
jgi:hypothetical protein